MSHEHDTSNGDERLHRYHDGELAPEERARVDASLQSDPEAQRKLAALGDLGGALRAAYGQAGGASEGFDVWPAVERGIADSKVVSLSQRLRRRAAPIWISTMAVAAAALAFAVFPRPWDGHPTNNCEIDEIEVSGANATIMKVADVHGGATTVLWLEE